MALGGAEYQDGSDTLRCGASAAIIVPPNYLIKISNIRITWPGLEGLYLRGQLVDNKILDLGVESLYV